MQKTNNKPPEEERYRDEAEFFDREAAELIEPGRSLKFANQLDYEQYFSLYRTYDIVKHFFGSVKDRKVLDYACGSGWVSIYFARSGAECYGFDISPKSVEVANKMAAANGLGERCHFRVCSAENLDFPDNTFDFIFGNAALHHTDLNKSPAEIARVLKPGGKAGFIDDLRYHPAMWLYRKITTDKHTRYEKPMVQGDIKHFLPYFSSVRFEAYDFLNLLPKWGLLSSILRPVDTALLKALPFMKHFYRHLIVKLVK
ncbi:MAG: class I SAM-dependent methyltransferase [candidate division Zixibacteria bacterium]|nr:class I SAM-dependent methyltransferase [candidate division Zixibacteria bacterium]